MPKKDAKIDSKVEFVVKHFEQPFLSYSKETSKFQFVYVLNKFFLGGGAKLPIHVQ